MHTGATGAPNVLPSVKRVVKSDHVQGMQFNHIRDYLNKGDAEVFSKCIVPFLKADSYFQSGEISEDTFTLMLNTCLINWLDNDTTTQERVLESLEDTMDKWVPVSLCALTQHVEMQVD